MSRHVKDFIPKDMNSLFLSVANLNMDYDKRLKEDSNLPNPDLYMYYEGLKNRTIWLDDVVDETTAIPITKMILAWNKEDNEKNILPELRKPIKLFIYTCGGGVEEIFHITDIIELSNTPVYTYNMGLALSAGLDLLISGHKRFALKNSKALYHSGSAGVSGTAEQVQSQTEQYSKQLEVLNVRILKKTKISKELLKKKKKSEWYISGEEQLKLGIVDTIITDISDLL